MKLSRIPDISNLKPEQLADVIKFVAIGFKDIYDALGNRLSFADNFGSQIIDVSFTAANTDLTIQHTLNRVPTGYVVLRSNAAATLYDTGGTNWNKTAIVLRSSAIANVTVMVF